jgi:methylated-DNA-protein-cysteine methyltransferase-like protein
MAKLKSTSQNSNLFKHVYEVVRTIPAGKVATYGQIAEILNGKWRMESGNSRIDARIIGWALHANRDPKIPCHRVVNKDGRLAPNFAFDGEKEQRRRLAAEGVTFKKGNVDLNKHLWG